MGEFYTSEEIVEEVLDAVHYRGKSILNKIILDPACGSGTFLIAAIRRIIDVGKEANLTNIELIRKISEQVVGIDVHPFAVTMAHMADFLEFFSTG